MKSSKKEITVLKQICKLQGILPENSRYVTVLTNKTGIFSPWSHIVSLFYTQLSHSLSLNDVCDALDNHDKALADIRCATAPKRNTFSHANRTREKTLLGVILKHLQAMSRDFVWNADTKALQGASKELLMP